MSALFSDRNTIFFIVVHDEAATVVLKEASVSGRKVQLGEMETLAGDFEKYINTFSSMGIWAIPHENSE